MTIEEKRVYADRAGRTTLLAATDPGVARVSVSGDIVGEFGLVHRGEARDVAVADAIAVATPEDALLAFEPTGFGPAVAVGFCDGDLVAAGPDGRVARRTGGAWDDLGSVGAPRAIAGDLLAADDGLYRLPSLDRLLDADCRDAVGTPHGPLVATPAGLVLDGERVLDGAFVAVAARGDRMRAATAERTYVRAGARWSAADLPADAPVAALAEGPVSYAVTAVGTLFVDAGDGWRSRALGLPGACALAVESESEAV